MSSRLVFRQGSPAASSRARTIAAWMALRNAARTPAISSSRIAAIRELEIAGVRGAFLNAIQAAMVRARELAAGDP